LGQSWPKGLERHQERLSTLGHKPVYAMVALAESKVSAAESLRTTYLKGLLETERLRVSSSVDSPVTLLLTSTGGPMHLSRIDPRG